MSEAVTAAFPKYDHVFAVISENRRVDQIIGNPNAPIINALASDYGLATNYTGVSDPSEPNYVAMLGGSDFGISTDWDVVETALDPGGTDIPLGITMSDSLVSICW